VEKIQNVAQVALEAGNSPKIIFIFSNYRELVKAVDARSGLRLCQHHSRM
jgi:hypothetical protein